MKGTGGGPDRAAGHSGRLVLILCAKLRTAAHALIETLWPLEGIPLLPGTAALFLLFISFPLTRIAAVFERRGNGDSV